MRFEKGQGAFFEMRVRKLCQARTLSPAELLARVDRGDTELTLRLAEAASTGYTELFREDEMFGTLQRRVLPSLPAEGPLRLWSAAAATGEEVYSVAICARESLGLDASRISLLGTDINDTSIGTAERGLYDAERLAGMTEARKAYFEEVFPGKFRVREAVRRLCTFRRFNLTQSDWPFEHRFHVIFLRNVLYYFDEKVRAQVVERCYDATLPGGWLVMSYTEPTLGLETRWRPCEPALLQKV